MPRHLFALSVLVLATAALPVLAQPALQLDILNGTYDNATETIVASENEFSLYALANPQNGQLSDYKILNNEFHLAIAVTPKTSEAGGSYGSFTIDLGDGGGPMTINVTDDMEFGNPFGGSHDHGIFDTHFTLIDFNFDAGDKAMLYNSEDNAGQGPIVSGDANQNTMYFKEFLVDTTNLSDEVEIHFDLFGLVKKGPHHSQLVFAPFSHDAESGGHGDDDDDDDDIPPPNGAVPEPISAATGLLALAGLGLTMRRRR